MVSYSYTYLFIDLIFLMFWAILFILRKDMRKEMLIISLIVGVFGFFTEIVYINDWWSPITITNTPIGIEDFFLSFTMAGISCAIYEFVFRKKAKNTKTDIKRLFLLIILGLSLFFGPFYLLEINSFISSIISLGTIALIICIKRKDLILDSIFSGALLLLIGFITYFFVSLLTPGWIDALVLFKNAPRIVFFNIIPIHDVIWFFLVGAAIGPAYEFISGAKLK